MNVNALPRARIAGGFLTLGLFVAALYVLRRELHEFTLHDVIHEFRSLPPWRLGLALGLTVLGYGALVGYDLLALHWIKHDLPLRRVAHAAFVGSAFANNIPMAFFVGGSVQYRLYSRAGITAAETAALGRGFGRGASGRPQAPPSAGHHDPASRFAGDAPAPALRVPAVLGALLAYRVIYFFIPFGIAVLLLGVREARAVA